MENQKINWVWSCSIHHFENVELYLFNEKIEKGLSTHIEDLNVRHIIS